MTPLALLPQAMEFARRGWAVVILMRRGYGGSGGGWAEDYGQCDHPDYRLAGQRGAADLRQAMAYLAGRPDVDTTRTIAIGVSAGAFATVAVTANAPAGLMAAINFAGGRGSRSNDTVCRSDLLVDAFRSFGATSQTPMLWIYAANDRFFGPELAAKFADAFAGAGGSVVFRRVPSYGEDGHFLFSGPGIPIWSPLVDEFLTSHGLRPRARPAALLPLSDVPPPPRLSAAGKAAFQAYLQGAPNKAFAYSPRGGSAWRSGQRTTEKAGEMALAVCNQYAGGDCVLHMVNDQAVK